MSIEDHLIRFAGARADGGPKDLIRLCLFDWAVCAVAGRNEPVTQTLLATPASSGPSAIFGSSSVDPATAALINGTMGHALDYDDTHFDHIGHTSAAIMPAVLAMAQAHNCAEMDRVLEAAVVGSEAAVRVGLWLGRDHYQVGFHQTATAGAFGATVGLARLLRLKGYETANALGLTATMASGLKGQFGTMGKPLNAGLAARTAVEAVTWARAGMTSDHAGLTAFGATHHGRVPEVAWDEAEPWKITRISHKFHACCHGLHAMLEALGQAPVDPDQLARIDVQTHPRWMSVCNKQCPETGLAAKFSYRQTAAMALLGVSTAAIENFDDEVVLDPRVMALWDKIEVTANDALSETQAVVRITWHNGTVDTRRHDLSVPLSLEDRQSRLLAKADAVVGVEAAAALWQAVNRDDITRLFD